MASAGTTAGRAERFDELLGRLAPRFERSDLRRRAAAYLRGLLGRVGRKNAWQLAEAAGVATPTDSSGCWAAPDGTPTRCATTSAATSSGASASPTAS